MLWMVSYPSSHIVYIKVFLLCCLEQLSPYNRPGSLITWQNRLHIPEGHQAKKGISFGVLNSLELNELLLILS